jgi:redox-sensing transcriptional repressor
MPQPSRIPNPTVKRLSLYLRELERLSAADEHTISSKQLGQALGLTDAQVRKDLAYFGQFGYPGIGYRVEELVGELRRIFGTDGMWRIVVVGAGHIGHAVMNYHRLNGKGFDVAAVVDNDPSIVGTEISGHVVQPMSRLAELVEQQHIDIGMLAVPPEAAQDVAQAMVDAGLAGILNFAPVQLNLVPAVPIVTVDLSVSLEQLAFNVSVNRSARPGESRSATTGGAEHAGGGPDEASAAP